MLAAVTPLSQYFVWVRLDTDTGVRNTRKSQKVDEKGKKSWNKLQTLYYGGSQASPARPSEFTHGS
jgi:hypothetical protein